MVVPETPEEYLAQLRSKFGWEEYLVFAVVLGSSAAIGIFHGFFSKRDKNNEEFLMGGRSMAAWPVALSLMCSFISALTVLGNPVETYLYGTQFVMIILTFIPLTLILIYVYVPVYFKLQLTSAYKYFEIRFNGTLRTLLSIIHCIHLLSYMAFAVYGPSLALNQVTGFDTILSVALIFAICVFYSTLGGFRAVIYTDVLQGVVMLASLGVVVIKGIIDVGGLEVLWTRLSDTGRLSFFRFDADFRTRHSVWSIFIGGLFMYLHMMAGLQANIQRYSSMPDIKTVRKSLWYNYIFLTAIISLCTLSGLVAFAKFYTCDPINAHLVERTDQILPLFVMSSLKDIPGLPGLFVAGLTCASLSSVSSALNALSAIVVEDYILKLKPDINGNVLYHASRAVSVIGGCASFLFVFVVRLAGDIFPTAISLLGVLMGPTFGLFSLGMMFPWANSMGALIGVIVSYGLSIFLGVGIATTKGLPVQRCSLSTEDCSEFFSSNSSVKYLDHSMRPADFWKDAEYSDYTKLMSISFLYLPMVCMVLTIVLGLVFSGVVSLLGWSKNEKPVNADCISPPFLWLWKKLFPRQMKQMISQKNLHTHEQDSFILK